MNFRRQAAGMLAGVTVLLLTGGASGAASPQLQPAGRAEQVQTGPVTIYKLPGENPGPWGIALDTRQRVWVTLDKTRQLGRLDPATGVWDLLPLPADFKPFLIQPGQAGDLWATDYEFEQGPDRPGRLVQVTDPETGAYSLWPVNGAAPAMFSQTPAGFVFTDINGGRVGTVPLTPDASRQPGHPLDATAVLTSPPAEAGARANRKPYPYGLAMDAKGRLWYAEAGKNRIIRVTAGKQETFAVPEKFWAPSDLAIDALGRVWIAGHATSSLLVMDAETGQALREVRLRLPDPEEHAAVARPNDVLAAADGIWTAEHEGGRIAHVLPDSYTVVEYPLPGHKNWAQWLAPAPGGGVWYAAFGTGEIGRVAAAAPAFHVRVNLPDKPVFQGGTVTGTVEIQAVGQSTGELTLELPDLPYQVTGTFDRATVKVTPEQPAQVKLTLQAGSESDLGTNTILAGGRMPGVMVTGSASLQVQKAFLGVPGLLPGHLAGLGAAVITGLGALALMRKRRRSS